MHVYVLILIKMLNVIVSFFSYIVEIIIFNIYVRRATTPKSRFTRVTFFEICMLSPGALHLLDISQYLKTIFNLQSGHKYMVEMAMFKGQ